VAIDTLGDAALLVTFGDRIELDLNRRAHGYAEAVERLRIADPRFGHPVTAYASVLIPYDPVAIDAAAARAIVAGLETEMDLDPSAGSAARRTAAVVEIPVRYGGQEGPDLAEVASMHDLRPSDVVALHAARTYDVFFLGFAPGFGYLGVLPAEIVTPRLARPRERVPAGSVGIAGQQTGIYPFSMPGGWRLIGRTERVMWDAERDPPALLAPGDRVRFVPSR
jgi:KipI family sensor histidine kinase inhibitor